MKKLLLVLTTIVILMSACRKQDTVQPAVSNSTQQYRIIAVRASTLNSSVFPSGKVWFKNCDTGIVDTLSTWIRDPKDTISQFLLISKVCVGQTFNWDVDSASTDGYAIVFDTLNGNIYNWKSDGWRFWKGSVVIKPW